MANIFISGSEGFIASHLIPALCKDGHKIYGYDLLGSKRRDIKDKFDLDLFFATHSIDLVIHLAAKTGTLRSDEFPEEYINTNVIGTNNIISVCRKYGVHKLIYFSSSSVYGGSDNALKETDLYNPLTLYGITKVAAEMLVKQSGLNYAIIRPFTVYGESGRRDMVIYKWIDRIKKGLPIIIYGDNTSRGYTYVGDLVNGVVSLVSEISYDDCFGKIYNLGGSEIVTIERLANIMADYCKKNKINFDIERHPLNNKDIRHSFADISLAKSELNFNPDPKMFSERLCLIMDSEFKDY